MRVGPVVVFGLLAALLPAGCAEPGADFMAQLGKDCAAGDRAACNVLRAPPDASAFQRIPGARESTRLLVEQDMEAIIRGMAQARAAPRPLLRENGSR